MSSLGLGDIFSGVGAAASSTEGETSLLGFGSSGSGGLGKSQTFLKPLIIISWSLISIMNPQNRYCFIFWHFQKSRGGKCFS